MPEDPVKVHSSVVTFNGYPVGRILDIGDGTESRNFFEFLACDSPTEDMESFSAGKNPGVLPLELLFEPSATGNYARLKADYDADTSATLTVAYNTGGANGSVTASIESIGTPHGPSDSRFKFSVTFKRSGALTHTPDS